MRTPITTLALAALVLAGCGESRLNPFNWFGGSEEAEAPTPAADVAPGEIVIDQEGLIAQVIELEIDPTPGGAIIRATGLPPTQGYHDAELVPVNFERPVNGVLAYRFVVSEPPGFERVGNQQSREIIVARTISNNTMASAQEIRVYARQNSLVSRR